jgi:hypothetical protein
MKLVIENHYPEVCICKDMATNEIMVRVFHKNSQDILSDMMFSLIMKFGKSLPKRILFREYERHVFHDHEVSKHMTKHVISCNKNCIDEEKLRTPERCYLEWSEDGTYKVKEI